MSDVEVRFGGSTTGLDQASQKAQEDINQVSNSAKKAAGGFDALNSTNRQVVKGLQLTGYQAQVLSYQLNDVFSGLMSGQRPMQVLMQQGPQITQVFGGLRGTFTALRAVMTPAVLGFGALAIGIGVAVASVIRFQSSMEGLERNLEGAGRAAGATAAQVDELAVEISKTTDVSTSAAREMAGAFAQTGKIGVEMFDDLIAISRDYQYAMGMDAKEATEDLGKAMADPIAGAEMLNDRMGLLDDTTTQYIRTLVEQGRQHEAQQILLDAVARATQGASDKAHGLAKAWHAVATGASDAFDWLGRAISRMGVLVRFGPDELGARIMGGTGMLTRYDQANKAAEASSRARAEAVRREAEANRLSLQAGEAARALLPKETQISRLRNQIELLRRSSNQGVIDANTAARAIKSAEDQIKDLQKPKRDRGGEAAARRAQRERERAAREALRVELATLDRQQQAVEDNFEEWNRIQDQKIEAVRKFHGEESVEYQQALEKKEEFARKFEENRRREEERAAERARRLEAQRLEMRARSNEAIAATDAELAQIQLDQERELIEQQSAQEEISTNEKLARLQQLAQRETDLRVQTAERIYQIQREALMQTLALAGLEEDEKARIYQDLEALEVQHQQNLRSIRAQGQATLITNQRMAANEVYSTWRGNISQMSGAFTGMFTQWAAGIQDFRTGWQNFGRSILSVIESAVTRMVENWIMGQLGLTTATMAGEATRTAAAATGATARTGITAGETAAVVAGETTEAAATVTAETAKTAATAAGAATRTGIEATAAATTGSITASTSLMQIAARAATAAAGAYSAVAAIPVVGPFLAPAMAAAALAGVLALGNRIFSAEGGWGKVPYDGAVTELHKDEMVLPATLANPLRDALAGMSPGATGVSGDRASSAGAQARADMLTKTLNPVFNFQPTVTAAGSTSLDQLLAREGSSMRRWISNQIRSGKLKVV